MAAIFHHHHFHHDHWHHNYYDFFSFFLFLIGIKKREDKFKFIVLMIHFLVGLKID